jgi:hypothetical protein
LRSKEIPLATQSNNDDCSTGDWDLNGIEAHSNHNFDPLHLLDKCTIATLDYLAHLLGVIHMAATSSPVKFEGIAAYKNEEEGGRDATCGCRDVGSVEGELVWGRDHLNLVC